MMVDRTSIEEVDADYYNLDDIMATKSTIACNYSPESPTGFPIYRLSCFTYRRFRSIPFNWSESSREYSAERIQDRDTDLDGFCLDFQDCLSC